MAQNSGGGRLPPGRGSAARDGRRRGPLHSEGGDFFETAPDGADAYLLGHIVHDWDDARAGLILDNLRRAMPAGAKLLLVEYVLPEGDGAWFGKLLDVHMMAVTGGLERTAAEYRQLFAAHGFRLTRVVPTAGDISVIEGVPA
ncbi:MAG: methylase RsmC [Gemmataceae bacterium]|nr:methylase RsmC [Gemmataceae bacterium]